MDMPQREYFCAGCGLFHWLDQYKTDESGKISVLPYNGCPNEECVSHDEHDVPVFAVDTFGYAYFAEANKQFIEEVKWSSPKYAPDNAIAMYRMQGIPIKDVPAAEKVD